MAKPEDFTLSPAFQAVAATGLDLPSLLDADLRVSRKPRLLVPIDVQVFRVREGDEVEHADVSTEAVLGAALEEEGSDATLPDPFSEGKRREPGMYIHWAVPDALVKGDLEVEDEEELRPGAEPTFRALPNRWVVTRFWFSSGNGKYLTKSVVIEADRGRVVPLEEWHETPELPEGAQARTPDVTPADLTAVMGGDPAWFAVFDNVADRFAYRDDVSDLGDFTGGIGYAVAGWFSDPTLDPLGGLVLRSVFDALLEDFAWAADLSGLHASTVKSAATIDQFKVIEPEGAVTVDDVKLYSDTVHNSILGKGLTSILPRPYWPQQSIYHGVVSGVRLSSGVYDAKPQSGEVEIGVGATGTEGLSALMAESSVEADEAADESLLNALQYGSLEALEDPSGLARLGEELHQRAFESEPGGWTTEQIREGDPFAHLRTPLGESRFDAFTDKLGKIDERPLKFQVVFDTVEGDPFHIAEQHTFKGFVAEESAPIQEIANIEGAGSGPKGEYLEPGIQFEFGRAEGFITPLAAGPSQLREQSRKPVDKHLTDPNRVTRPDPKAGLTFRTVKRALPRLYYPQDPVVTFRGLHRSQRHQEDGRFDDEGRLVCRLSDDTVKSLEGVVDGRDLLLVPLQVGAIPFEVRSLLHEAILQANGEAENLARVGTARNPALDGVFDQLMVRLTAEERFFARTLDPRNTVEELATHSIRNGKMASAVATTVWHQPWIPLYLEWKLTATLDTTLEGWVLGELDFEPSEGTPSTVEREITGRALLSKAGATAVAELLARAIDEEENLDDVDRVLTNAQLDRLRELDEAAGDADVLAASLEGFRSFLLGIRSNVRFTPRGEQGEILPTEIPDLLRAGRARLDRLRAVDAFGRYLEFTPPFSFADSVEIPGDDGSELGDQFRLAPRLVPPSRLWFRLVDASDDRVDAVVHQGGPEETELVTRSPVAAWLLPDHVDHALEVFDETGEPLGQLRNERLGRGVVWEGAPGRPGPMGRPPFADIANRHAAELARALVQRDAAERQAETGQKESTLDAFLRVIDTTLWTVDPFADSGLDYYAKMTGRPVAVVRARLLLDVVSDSELFPEGSEEREERRRAYDALSRLRFDVRLGALTRADDGLVGYFVNDDYWHFYPVHASVPENALAGGPHQGYIDAQVNIAEFDAEKPLEPIDHPYVVGDPTVPVQSGHPVMLTLLLDPGTRVHATSGILPRKSISLPRGFVDKALSRIAPSFRFGPALVDPTVIRMPKPSVLPTEQVWTRRDTPISWRDDPIEAATQFAYLPETSAEAQEGYIRVRMEADRAEQ